MPISEKVKKELRSWGIMLSVFAVLYFTGLHTEVIGGIQRLVLFTGLIKPDMEVPVENQPDADYNFQLIDESGKIIEGNTLKGKTIFMNIWATWCPPCVAEMPDINNLYNEIKSDDDVVFLMISHDDNFETAKKFKKKKGFDLPIHQLKTNLPSVYNSNSIPTTFVISPDGKIATKRAGYASYNNDDFKKFLKSLRK